MASFFKKFNKNSLTSEVTRVINEKVMPQPTVHQEITIMLSGALTIYIFADLRDLARSGKATIPLEDMEPPMSVNKVLGIIKDNKDALKESGAHEEIEERLTALDNLTLHNNFGIMNKLLGETVHVVEFVDKNAKKELVHAITVNDAQKRITVVFRGSVTPKDFITDARIGQIKVDNPAYKLNNETSQKNLCLHFGFHEYLFKKKCPNNKNLSRYEGILASVKKILKEKPGYKLNITGHSLGGALCTLFGFFAAADDEIIQLASGPVRVVSIASPYVGDAKFLLAFQSLERLNRLRHLRAANAEDLVSLMPIASPKLGVNVKDLVDGIAYVYRHCGIKLHLNELSKAGTEPIYKLTYSSTQNTEESIANEIYSFFEDTKNFVASIKKVLKKSEQADVLRYHSCDEYELRINECKADLNKITLEDLYKDKNIVGDVLDPDHVPSLSTAAQFISKISGSPMLKTTIKDILSKK